MAKYDYRCAECENIQEEEHGMNEKPEVKCEKCGGECSKTFLASTPVHYKGPGWDRSPHILVDKVNGRKRTKYGSREDK